jgi:F0F1-type ATP synthase assembly protein I
MRECPHCHKDLPDDSEYCTYCGTPLSKEAVQNKKVEDLNDERKENPNPSNLGKFSLFVTLFGVIVLDFILGSTVATITNTSAKWVFIISLFVYITAIVLAVMSLIKDVRDRRNGFKDSGNSMYAVAAIVFSTMIALVNLSNVILK